MSEQSVIKEVKNCVSNVASSGAAALASNSVHALTQSKTADAVAQTVFSVLQESRKTPCSSLIRALDPQLRVESFQLLQGTKAIATVVPTSEGTKPKGGLIAVFRSVALLSDEERRKGQKAEIAEIRNDKKGLGGIHAMVRDGQKTFEDLRTAQLLISQSSAPNSAIHSMYQGVAAQDLFSLAAGPIVAIFAIEMVLSRLRGYMPIGINRNSL